MTWWMIVGASCAVATCLGAFIYCIVKLFSTEEDDGWHS